MSNAIDLINKWKKKFICNLKNNRNRKTDIYFIPKDYETQLSDDSNIKETIKAFNNSISEDNGENVIPKSDFFVIEKRDFQLYDRIELIISDAEYINNKFIVDLGNDNFYFYYLGTKGELCEGYFEKFNDKEIKKIKNEFSNNSIEGFIQNKLSKEKPEINDNKIIYNLKNYKIVFKNDEDLMNIFENENEKNVINNNETGNEDDNNLQDKNIKSYKRENKNNKISGSKSRNNFKEETNNNNNLNKDNSINKNQIIKCLLHYYYSNLDYNGIIENGGGELDFFPIDSEWIKQFKEKYNYNYYKEIIEKYEIEGDNYEQYLNKFNNINFEKINPIPPIKEIPINYGYQNITIYKDYELISPEAKDVFHECFGKEKIRSNKLISLDLMKLDDKFFLIKYSPKIYEIIKIKKENERVLIVGKNELDNNILPELKQKGFLAWIKNNNINEYKVPSLEINENKKEIGKLYYLPKLGIYNEEDNKEKDNSDNKLDNYNNREENNKKKGLRYSYKERYKINKDKQFINYNNKNDNINNEDKEKEKEDEIETNEYKKHQRIKSARYNNTNNLEKENDDKEEDNYDEEEDDYDIVINNKNPNGLVGLVNIGATCYMNADLQCFNNIPKLRNYFLKNKAKIRNKKLSSSLLTVFENLWESKNIDYYEPTEFKRIISQMNPLFQGIQANDSKDLILFILETIHNELNEINNSINNENDNYNTTDYNAVYNNFKNYFLKNYNSVISNLFYGLINSMMTCCNCNTTTHNIQTFNILFFPLEEIRKFKGYQQNIVNIYDCFDYNQKQELMAGPNQIFCNYCNQYANALNQTRLIICPNVLIINLNRGKGLMFDVKLIFEEFIEIKNYVFYTQSPHYYELIGVVSHYGTSDMGGHFIAFCKNSENLKWYKYNDSMVTETSFNEVINSGVPYVLFYNYIKSN